MRDYCTSKEIEVIVSGRFEAKEIGERIDRLNNQSSETDQIHYRYRRDPYKRIFDIQVYYFNLSEQWKHRLNQEAPFFSLADSA